MYLEVLNSLILNLSLIMNYFTPLANVALVSLTQVPNLPPVSTTPAIPLTKFAAGVVTLVANLASVSLIPVVHLACKYFAKF